MIAPISSGLAARELRRRFIGVSVGSQLSNSPSTNGRGAVGGGLGGGAGTAAQLSGLQAFQGLLRARRRGEGVVRAELEVGQDGGDVDVVAVGVVVGGALTEGAQRARQVGGVGAEDSR